MQKWLKILYKCYLGKNKGIRLDAIFEFIKQHNGREFFKKFSTVKDSILDFLKRCDKEGIDI